MREVECPPVLETIRPALDHLLYIMQSKDLQRQQDIIRIQKELRHVLELENVWCRFCQSGKSSLQGGGGLEREDANTYERA